MISSRLNRFILVVFTFLFFELTFYSCIGGDEAGSGRFTASSIIFIPDGPGEAGDIWLELDSAEPSKNYFKLRVIGDGIKNAYGVAGRLKFDRSFCTLKGARAGNALEGGSAEVVAAGGSNEEGAVFGFSRSMDYRSSSDISANEVIGYLEFTVSSTGTTRIEFVSKRCKILTHELEEVEVKDWLGGTLIVD